MPESSTSIAEPDLRQYFEVLKRRKWIIIAVVVLAVGSSLVYSFTQPTLYEARSAVILKGGAADAVLRGETVARPIGEQVATEVRIMDGDSLQARIGEQLGYEPDITTEVGEDSPVISILSRDTSPAQAAAEASDFATEYAEQRKASISDDLVRSIEDVRVQIDGLDAEVAQKQERLGELDGIIAATDTSDERRRLQAEKSRLQVEVTPASIAARQASLQEDLDNLVGALGINQNRGSFTVATAKVPENPVSPKPLLNAGIALLTGLVLGIGAAFARDFLDDTMRTKEDLDRASGGVAVLSIVPSVPSWRSRDDAVLESVVHPHSITAEAYRSLRTSLEFAAIEHKLGIVHVTSASSGEGKTTTATNLAVALAGTGKRVILVDCDLRRPRVHKFFNLENSEGFTSVLIRDADVQETLRPIAAVPGLFVLPSGPRPPNPAEVLDTHKTRTVLTTMARFADHVVVDSPPLLPVADSSILAGVADACILVVAARSTTKRSLGRAIELLDQVNAPLEGLVFNSVGQEATYGYAYGDEPLGYTDGADDADDVEDDDASSSSWRRSQRTAAAE